MMRSLQQNIFPENLRLGKMVHILLLDIKCQHSGCTPVLTFQPQDSIIQMMHGCEYDIQIQSNVIISPHTVPNTVLARGEVGKIMGDTVWTFL